MRRVVGAGLGMLGMLLLPAPAMASSPMPTGGIDGAATTTAEPATSAPPVTIPPQGEVVDVGTSVLVSPPNGVTIRMSAADGQLLWQTVVAVTEGRFFEARRDLAATRPDRGNHGATHLAAARTHAVRNL